MSAHETEERLTELEIRNAFLEQRVSALDDVLTRFTARVEVLQAEFNRLRDQVADLPPLDVVAAPQAEDSDETAMSQSTRDA